MKKQAIINKKRYVLNTKGGALTRATLPPIGFGIGKGRWTVAKKNDVAKAIVTKLITMDEAVAWYGASAEEWNQWIDLSAKFGVEALRTTRVQDYRS